VKTNLYISLCIYNLFNWWKNRMF